MSVQVQSSAQGALCACGTDEERAYAQIANVMDLYRDKEGSLIQVLHLAQGIYGHLPLELQKFISKGMRIPLAEVSGVVSFYSFFSTEPRGEHTIRVCLGTACYVRGSKRRGSMGPTFASFGSEADARKFIEQYGGEMLRFSDIKLEMVDLHGGANVDGRM